MLTAAGFIACPIIAENNKKIRKFDRFQYFFPNVMPKNRLHNNAWGYVANISNDDPRIWRLPSGLYMGNGCRNFWKYANFSSDTVLSYQKLWLLVYSTPTYTHFLLLFLYLPPPLLSPQKVGMGYNKRSQISVIFYLEKKSNFPRRIIISRIYFVPLTTWSGGTHVGLLLLMDNGRRLGEVVGHDVRRMTHCGRRRLHVLVRRGRTLVRDVAAERLE